MDDTQTMKETQPNLDDRPLVTFALVAYNQEKYIREAVEGAFSQTYVPLEIILSDDFSSDRTYEIMQEMAIAYQGIHKVTAIQQDTNLGTVRHVIAIANKAQGNLLVLNAGDDISYPDRTSALANKWLQSGASALYSNYDLMSEKGGLIKNNLYFLEHPHTKMLFRSSKTARRVGGKFQSVPGFAAAYRTTFWSHLPPPDQRLLVEDGLATILLNMNGELIAHVDQPLISYRKTPNSLSMRTSGPSTVEIMAQEAKISDRGKDISHRITYILNCGYVSTERIEPSVLKALKCHQHHGDMISGFWQQSYFHRLRYVTRVRTVSDFRFIFPRLFGKQVFLFFKKCLFRMRFILTQLAASFTRNPSAHEGEKT